MLAQIRYIIHLILLCSVQVMVFNHIHLYGYAMPIITPLMLLYRPINEGHINSMLRLFLLGLCLDLFSGTPGQHSASLTLLGMLRPLLLRLTTPKEHAENMIPSRRTMGNWNHFMLLLLSTWVNHLAYFTLEGMNYFSSTAFLLTLISSIGLSMALMILLEMLRDNKGTQNE